MVHKIENYVERAAGRLFHQYEKSPNILAIQATIVEPLQDLENDNHILYKRLVIGEMSGVQLDLIGELVKQPRYGLPDAQYRARLYSKIAVNNSTGIRDDVFNFINIIAGGREGYIQIIEVYPASFQVGTSILFTEDELTFIKQSIYLIKPMGVYFGGLIVQPPSGLIFTYADEDLIPLPNSGGYGDDEDSTVGGQYADIF